MFFQLLSTIKVNLMDKMKRITYLYVTVYTSSAKISCQFVPFLLGFLILGKIQDGDHV